jgi:hypothetical protein
LTEIYNAIPTIYPGDFLASSTYLGITGSIAVKTGDTASVISSTSTNKLLLTPPVGYYSGSVTVSTTSTNFTAANIKSGIFLFGILGSYTGSGGAAAANKTPLKTGQILCYDAAGALTACAGTGQDGEIQAGTARSYTDNSNETISDNATGLMWQKCINGLSGADCTTGTATKLTWSNAIANCEGLATAGHTDWKLPNINELSSLVDYSTTSPAINRTYFPNTAVNDDYWSSTQNVYSRPQALILEFGAGEGTNQGPIGVGTNYFRCVRVASESAAAQPLRTNQDLCFSTTSTGWGSTPTAEISCTGTGQDGEYQAGADRSYTNNGDGTISDGSTGLMWERCPYGFPGTECDFNENITLPTTFINIIAVCTNSTTGGYTDWRLPNVNELSGLLQYKRLIDENGSGPLDLYLDRTYFPNPGYSHLQEYTSSTRIPSSSSAWVVHVYGEIFTSGAQDFNTRCVR